MPGLFHNLNYLVERNTMHPVGESRIEICVQSTGGSISITLNTRYLNQSAYRITSHSEMMLQSHFRSIFDRSEEHTSELQSRQYLVCRLLLEKKKRNRI